MNQINWKLILVTVVAIVSLALAFAAGYSAYLSRLQKRADDFLRELRPKARLDQANYSVRCICEVAQLFLGVPLRFLEPEPATGFSPRDFRQLIALALALGDQASLYYGWFGIVKGGGLERNGDPQLWIDYKVSKNLSYVIQCRGGDAAITLNKLFYASDGQNHYLATAATISCEELREIVAADSVEV